MERKPDYERGDCKLYCGDCNTILSEIGISQKSGYCILSDPPYGIGYDPMHQKHDHATEPRLIEFYRLHGDDVLFDPTPWIAFRDCFLWGANNYCNLIPPREGQWYFWDKVTRNELQVRISEGEFAWHKNGTKPRCFRHLWSGAYRMSESGQLSVHPTQKPIALMEWCLSMMKSGPICDPYMGSGTTAIACIRKERPFVGVEIDAGHFQEAVKRVEKEFGRLALFDSQVDETERKEVQRELL